MTPYGMQESWQFFATYWVVGGKLYFLYYNYAYFYIVIAENLHILTLDCSCSTVILPNIL